jgi:hypothetical protein
MEKKKVLLPTVLGGLILLLIAGAVSAHGFAGYGYGMPMMGYGGYGMPATGYGISESVQQGEFVGNVTAVYPMFVQLDNGKSVYIPGAFNFVRVGDVVSGEGVEYGWIVPNSLKVNGETINIVNQNYPTGYGVPMMGYGGYRGYGMGYGMGMGYCHQW